MLSACNVLLGASSVSVTAVTLPKERSLLRYSLIIVALILHSSSADLTHHGNFLASIPPQQGKAQETILKQCLQERDNLATKLDELIMEQAVHYKKCQNDLKHYDVMIGLIGQQTRRLKQMVADRSDESELPHLYEAKYTAIMCTKVHDGLIMRSSRTAVHDVMDICGNKTSLSDYSLESASNDVMQSYEGGGYIQQFDAAVAARHSNIVGWHGEGSAPAKPRVNVEWHSGWATELRYSKQDASGKASPECFQARALQNQVDSTRKAKEAQVKSCRAEVARQKRMLELRKREEDALWTKYDGHVSQRASIKHEKAQQTAVKLCALLVTTGEDTPCDSERMKAVEDAYAKSCLP